jgi:hypothetical protein
MRCTRSLDSEGRMELETAVDMRPRYARSSPLPGVRPRSLSAALRSFTWTDPPDLASEDAL